MSQFKNNPDFNLYYSDTDSAYVDRPLPDHLVSNTEVGKLKLENIAERAIFLAPKFYCLDLGNGNIVSKVKGLSKDIKLDISDFERLLTYNSTLEKLQQKWFKSITEGTISIKDQLYTLKATGNKRELVYSNDILSGTRPYTINNDKSIIVH